MRDIVAFRHNMMESVLSELPSSSFHKRRGKWEPVILPRHEPYEDDSVDEKQESWGDAFNHSLSLPEPSARVIELMRKHKCDATQPDLKAFSYFEILAARCYLDKGGNGVPTPVKLAIRGDIAGMYRDEPNSRPLIKCKYKRARKTVDGNKTLAMAYDLVRAWDARKILQIPRKAREGFLRQHLQSAIDLYLDSICRADLRKLEEEKARKAYASEVAAREQSRAASEMTEERRKELMRTTLTFLPSCYKVV